MEEAKKVPGNPEGTKNRVKNKNKAAGKVAKEDKSGKETAKKVPARSAGSATISRESFVTRTRKFLRSAYVELKKVNWLGRDELIKFTGVVLVSVVIVGIAIFVVDSLLSNVLELIIK